MTALGSPCRQRRTDRDSATTHIVSGCPPRAETRRGVARPLLARSGWKGGGIAALPRCLSALAGPGCRFASPPPGDVGVDTGLAPLASIPGSPGFNPLKREEITERQKMINTPGTSRIVTRTLWSTGSSPERSAPPSSLQRRPCSAVSLPKGRKRTKAGNAQRGLGHRRPSRPPLPAALRACGDSPPPPAIPWSRARPYAQPGLRCATAPLRPGTSFGAPSCVGRFFPHELPGLRGHPGSSTRLGPSGACRTSRPALHSIARRGREMVGGTTNRERHQDHRGGSAGHASPGPPRTQRQK